MSSQKLAKEAWLINNGYKDGDLLQKPPRWHCGLKKKQTTAVPYGTIQCQNDPGYWKKQNKNINSCIAGLVHDTTLGKKFVTNIGFPLCTPVLKNKVVKTRHKWALSDVFLMWTLPRCLMKKKHCTSWTHFLVAMKGVWSNMILVNYARPLLARAQFHAFFFFSFQFFTPTLLPDAKTDRCRRI